MEDRFVIDIQSKEDFPGVSSPWQMTQMTNMTVPTCHEYVNTVIDVGWMKQGDMTQSCTTHFELG